MNHPMDGESTNKVESRYALVIAVAKRAKQIREGAPRMVESKSKNPITVAIEEIAAGKINITHPTAEQIAAAEHHPAAAVPSARAAAAELLKIPEEEAKPVEAVEAETVSEATAPELIEESAESEKEDEEDEEEASDETEEEETEE